MNQVLVNDRIKKVIEHRGQSISAVAQAAGMKREHLSQVVNKYKNSKGTPKGLSDRKLKLVAKYLKVDWWYLKTGLMNNLVCIDADIALNTIEVFDIEKSMEEEDMNTIYKEKFNQYDIGMLHEKMDALNDKACQYFYTMWDGLKNIEDTEYLFLNFMTQLNKKGLKKIEAFIHTINVETRDVMDALEKVHEFRSCERILNTLESSFTMEEAIRYRAVMKERVSALDDKQQTLFYDKMDELLTLDHNDFSMLALFTAAKNREEVFSEMGCYVSKNQERILDYLEMMLHTDQYVEKIYRK